LLRDDAAEAEPSNRRIPEVVNTGQHSRLLTIQDFMRHSTPGFDSGYLRLAIN
jgi:hypothetical protein